MTDTLAAIERLQQRDIDLLYRTLADALRIASADLPGDQVATMIEAGAMLREFDRGLDVIFGRYQGDADAALRTIVVRGANRARFQPLDDQVQAYRKALPDEIVHALEEVAGV